MKSDKNIKEEPPQHNKSNTNWNSIAEALKISLTLVLFILNSPRISIYEPMPGTSSVILSLSIENILHGKLKCPKLTLKLTGLWVFPSIWASKITKINPQTQTLV